MQTLAYLLPLLTRLQPWLPENRYRSKAPRVSWLLGSRQCYALCKRTAGQQQDVQQWSGSSRLAAVEWRQWSGSSGMAAVSTTAERLNCTLWL